MSQEVFDVHFNRPVRKHNYRTSLTVGARAVQQTLGLTGAGVGVAVIDSGITAWHDDLTSGNVGRLYPVRRTSASSKFVDFVQRPGLPYDDNGHGTHVAGHHRRQRLRFERPEGGRRAGREPRSR